VCVHIFSLNSKKYLHLTLQVIGLHTSSIMSHPHYISPLTHQHEGPSNYDAPIPWELTPFCFPDHLVHFSVALYETLLKF